MLLAYTYNHEIKNDKPFLAIIPDIITDRTAKPVPIEKLSISDCAIFYVSNYEAVCVKREDNGLVISPLAGQRLYLTTNLPDRPGISARMIKITKGQNQSFVCHYQKEKDTSYSEWTPYKINV